MKTPTQVFLAVLFFLCFLLGVWAGKNNKQKEIENRAIQTFVATDTLKTKTCYTQQDIELIIFNKIQE